MFYTYSLNIDFIGFYMLKTTNQPTSGCYFKMLVSMFFASLIYFSRTIEIKNKFGLFKYFNDLLLVTGKK